MAEINAIDSKKISSELEGFCEAQVEAKLKLVIFLLSIAFISAIGLGLRLHSINHKVPSCPI
jgi:hypothetical protein